MMTMISFNWFRRKRVEPPKDPIEEKLEKLAETRARLRQQGRHDFNPARRELHAIAEEDIRNGTDETYRPNRDVGPWVSIKASCDSCMFFQHEWTRIVVTGQPDVDHRESRCTHESVGRRTLPYNGNTPPWCPYVGNYVEQLMELWQPPRRIPKQANEPINGLPSTSIKVPIPEVHPPRRTYTAETHCPSTPPPAKQ